MSKDLLIEMLNDSKINFIPNQYTASGLSGNIPTSPESFQTSTF